jgi:hypothetical protein
MVNTTHHRQALRKQQKPPHIFPESLEKKQAPAGPTFLSTKKKTESVPHHVEDTSCGPGPEQAVQRDFSDNVRMCILSTYT